MVSLAFKGGIILAMILSGAINTIDFKFQNTDYVFEGPFYKLFFHPYIQTLIMFFAEFLSLPTHYIRKWKNPKIFEERKKEAESNGKIIGMNKLYLFIPAFFDLLSSTMQFMALNFIPASAYQMLRGGTIITTFLFSVTLLKQKIKRSMLIGTGSALVGVIIVGTANTIYSTNSDQDNGALQIVGYLLIIVSLFTNGFFYAFQQKLLSKYYLEPLQVVGFQGLFGFTVYLGIVPALCYIPCSFGKEACVHTNTGQRYMQGFSAFWYAIRQSNFLLGLTIFSIISTMVFNVAGVAITKYINSLARAITDVTKTILVWVISIIVTVQYGNTFSNYKWEIIDTGIIVLQIVGFIFLVMGNLVYNEIINLPKICQPKQVIPQTDPLLDKENTKE